MDKVLRYLATYVPKTDKSISLASEIFKYSAPPPEPPLPNNIHNLIPTINDKLKSWTNTDTLIQCYKLNYDIRSPLINAISPFICSSESSKSQNEYLSIISIQSCCTLFFTPIEQIESNDFNSFMKCLKLSIPFLPETLKVFPDFFALIFERILSVDYQNHLLQVLSSLQIFANDYPQYTSSCINTHVNIFSRLAGFILKGPTAEELTVISNQLFIISKAFESNSNVDKEIYKKVLPELFLIMGHLMNQKSLSIVVFPIISLFVILKKETDCDIFKLNELLVFLIKGISSMFDFQPSERFEFLKNYDFDPIQFKFIDSPTFQENVTCDVKNIYHYDDLEKHKNDEDKLLIQIAISLGQQLQNFPYDITSQILTGLFSSFEFQYSYFAFLFPFIQQFDKNYQKEICQTFSDLHLWNQIFGYEMFDPTIPNDSPIISIRKSLFVSLGLLSNNKEAALIIRVHYVQLLKSILHLPFLFSHVFQLSYPSFMPVFTLNIQDDLYTSIMYELIYQQQLHLNGDKDSPLFRIPTMTVLSAILQNNDAVSLIITSKYFCCGVLHFLYETAVQSFFSEIIEQMLQYFVTNNKIDSTALNESFHLSFLYLIENIKDDRAMNIILQILNLFTYIFQFEPSFIAPSLVISSSNLSDFMTILVDLPVKKESIRVMEIGLMLLSALHACSNFNYEAVPFEAIGESVERLGLTNDFLLLIYQIIFSLWNSSKIETSSTTFSKLTVPPSDFQTTIVVPEALPLLLISVRKTNRYHEVLRRLIDLCTESVCNCCSCLMANVPTIVFENTDPNNEEGISLALELFIKISRYVSNRQSLFSFFRLFSSSKANILNPLTLQCIKSLEQIISESEKPSFCSLIQFSSENSIIKLPPLAIRDIQSGFVISSKVLLDSSELSRFFFEFGNDTQTLSASFSYGTIIFNINDTPIMPSFELPLRKWFTLSIFFKSLHFCEVYFDDSLIEQINLHNVQFTDFKKCSMFHKCSTDPEALPLQVQHVTISAKSNSWNLSTLTNISLSNYTAPQSEIKTFLGSSTKIFEFHADKVVPYDSGKNTLTKIPSAHYTGLTIRFFTNFLKVFEASHSVSFLITLFAKIDFVDPTTFKPTNELLQRLLSLLVLLVSKSPDNNMLAINPWSIISFFLIESLPTHLTVDTWNSFFIQMKTMTLIDEKEKICQWILFNYNIWDRAAIETKIQVFSDWQIIVDKWPSFSNPYLSFQLLLYIFRRCVPSKENIPFILEIEDKATLKNNSIDELIPKLTKARQLICSLMTKLAGNDLKDTDSDLLFYTIVGINEDQSTIELLDFVKLLLVKFDLSQKISQAAEHVNLSMPWNYLTTVISIKSTWASIYLNLSEKVCCKFMSIYVDTTYVSNDDTNKYCQFLIARRTSDFQNDEDNSDLSLVTNSCRLMLRIEENTSMKNMIEMDSLFLQIPTFLVYAICSCISSSVKLNDLFVQFFDKLCMNDQNVTMISEKLSTYSLYYLMYWAIKRRHEALGSISKIVIRSTILTQKAINLIDSFSISTNCDLSEIRSTFLTLLMESLSKIKLNASLAQIAEVLALAVLFRSHPTTNHNMEKAFRNSPFYYSDYEKQNEKEETKIELPEIEFLSSFYVTEPNPESPILPTFSLYYDSNGKWLEAQLAKRIISFLSVLWTSFDVEIHQLICILINELIQETNEIEDLCNLPPIVEKLVDEYNINDEFVNLVLGTIQRRMNEQIIRQLFSSILSNVLSDINQISPSNQAQLSSSPNNSENGNNQTDTITNNIPNISAILNLALSMLTTAKVTKYKRRKSNYKDTTETNQLNVSINDSPTSSSTSNLIDLARSQYLFHNIFIIGFFALNNYCDQPPASLPAVIRELVFSFFSILEQFPKTPRPLSPEVNHQLSELMAHISTSMNEKHQVAARHWRYMWQQMSHDRSPFYINHNTVSTKIHWKRSPFLNNKFLTPILKRNTAFNRHSDASVKRDSYPPNHTFHSIPRANSSVMSSFSSHLNFFREASNDMLPELDAVPNRFLWKARCQLVKITKTTEGSFLVSTDGFSILDADSDETLLFIPANEVDMIFQQYYLQRPTAIEIFTTRHKSYFINFPDSQSHKFMTYFTSIPMPNARFIQKYAPKVELARLDLTRKWTTREISTFEYLMWINELSGRSMNNLNAYPIFPWILSDYSSEKLDLTHENSFRDLSKPIGALNPSRLEKLKALNDALPDIDYLYQSTYSSLFMVIHLLVRMEPFTSIHIKYQDGKFDVATRIFTSIADCYQRCLNNNNNFRELIPEFFFCPEFLINNDKFNLGTLPNGTVIDDVVLPAWAKTADEFIHYHKMALESDYVSTHINQWIDLIWGYKQSGQEAIHSNNTFDPRLYPDCWQKVGDPNDVPVIEDMLMKIGVIPQQIFDSPHPSRQLRSKQDSNKFKSLNSPAIFMFGEIEFIQIQIANSPVLDTKLVNETIDKLTIYSLHNEGRVFMSKLNSTIVQICRERIGKIAIHASSSTDSALFAFATENSSGLIVANSYGTIIQKVSSLHIDAISCACSYKNDFITGGKDSIVVKWSLNDKQELENTKSLMAHADTVSCVTASQNFGIVVSCSVDGLLVASIANDFSFMMALEMEIEKVAPGSVPLRVMITEMTGRILVHCANPKLRNENSRSDLIFMYTLNGRFVTQLSLDKSIKAWCQASRKDDCDFLVLADSSNSVYLYDAFNMSLVKKIFIAPAKVTHLRYYKQLDLIVIGMESGSVFLGPLFSY